MERFDPTLRKQVKNKRLKRKIHILGGGVVGLSSAWYLSELGYDVTVIERNDFRDGASHGNAGMIVPSHFVPMAAPGVIAQGIKWMFDSKSPFYIKPRLSPSLVEWLWKFKKSCTPQHVENSMPILLAFNEMSKQLYKEFSMLPEFNFGFEEKGLMMLYKTEKQRKEEIELAHKAHELGINAEIVEDEVRLKRLEPNVTLNVLGGIFFPDDGHLYPNQFINQLYTILQNKGVRFLSQMEVVHFRKKNSVVEKILLSDNSEIEVDLLLVTGGAWTPHILKKLGVKLLIQDGKGYSFTLKNQISRPAIPTILSEAKVAVTPMGNDLRIGGTLELGGMSSKIDPSRLQGIIESIPKYYPFLKINKPDISTVWHGYRPCTPDGLPYIGNIPSYDNLFVASGHGMMGMSLGPATGKIISEMISGQETSIHTHMFRIDRM